jgi:site-specific DNA recombinase
MKGIDRMQIEMVTPRQQTAAIYTRVSSTRQEVEGASLETQEAACRQHCAKMGWEVSEEHVYRETHKRWLLHERPRLTELREAVRARKIDIVVCFCVDRLSSQDSHVYILDEEFGRAGVEMAFATEDFEQTAIGRFVRSAKVLAAAIEVEKIRERTVRGRIARVKSGKLIPGGKPLYGYRWPDERDHNGRLIKARLIEDPDTAKVVQRIFELLASGRTLRAIANTLTADHIDTPTKANRQWTTSVIARMAHRTAYKGEAFGWGNTKSNGTRPQHFDPEKAIPLPEGTIPPLVDVVTWESVQVILENNKKRAVRSAKNPEAALLRAGYVRCGYCGTTMYPRPRSNGSYDYVCKRQSTYPGVCPNPTIVCHALDTAVWERIREIILNPDLVRQQLDRIQGDNHLEVQFEAVQAALKRLEKRKVNMVETLSLIDDADARAPMLAHLNELTFDGKKLRSELDSLQTQIDGFKERCHDLRSIEQWCERVGDSLDASDFAQKRMILDALGVSARLFRKDHEPRYVIRCEIDASLVSTTT